MGKRFDEGVRKRDWVRQESGEPEARAHKRVSAVLSAVVVVTAAADVVGCVPSLVAVTAVEVGRAREPDTDPVVVSSLVQPAASTTITATTRTNGSGRQGFTLTSFTP